MSKFLDSISITYKKFFKGFITLIIIQLFIVGTISFVQSCQDDESNIKEQLDAKNNFINSLKNSFNSLKDVRMNNENNIISAKSGGTNTNVCDTYEDVCYYTNDGNWEPFENLYDFFEAQDHYFIDEDGNIYYGDPTTDQYYHCESICSEEVHDSFVESLEDAKDFLRTQGYSESDITNLFTADEDGPAINESALVPTIMVAIALEESNQMAYSTSNFTKILGSQLLAQQVQPKELSEKIYDCALRAVGIEAVTKLIQEGIKGEAGKAALKKAIRKVAARAAGWVGAAWAAYEFGSCMEWY